MGNPAAFTLYFDKWGNPSILDGYMSSFFALVLKAMRGGKVFQYQLTYILSTNSVTVTSFLDKIKAYLRWIISRRWEERQDITCVEMQLVTSNKSKFSHLVVFIQLCHILTSYVIFSHVNLYVPTNVLCLDNSCQDKYISVYYLHLLPHLVAIDFSRLVELGHV